jgi:diguanylate cyclase (GGDEF)-like protein
VQVTDDAALREVERLEDSVRFQAAGALSAAQRWLTNAGPGTDPVLRQRVRLVRADGQARTGQPETSMLVMREISAWAVEHDEVWLRARCHRLLSGRYRRAGDAAVALEHAVAAVDLLPADARASERADHLVVLADALGEIGSFEQSLRRYAEAAAIAQHHENHAQWKHILNNVAYTHFQAGNAEEAVATSERLMFVAARAELPLDIYDRDTIARAYLMMDRHEDAVAILTEAGVEGFVEGAAADDGTATAMLTLAEIHRLSGALEPAQVALDRARNICRTHGLTGPGIEVLREQAEVHAARGDHEKAFATFKEFHEQMNQLRAVEREGRARTLQAIYEADEARRDSDRFRELSVRDPLTGLLNRRYVDEHLGAQLLYALDTSSALSLAIVDLDHFKRVNDQRSHDIGDQVLRQIAGILEATVADHEGATAVRLGGEEFLLLLPGLDNEHAGAILQRLCATIRAHHWEPLTSGIPVTVSVGLASAPRDGVDRTPLLACADRRLYTAKAAGRDRVVAHDGNPLLLEPVS